MPWIGTSSGRLAVALGTFAIALGSRLLIEPTAPGRLPYLTFFPAVLVTAILCGQRFAWLVLALSAVAGAMILPDVVALKVYAAFLFSIVGAVNIYVVEHLVSTRQRLKEREEQLAIVNRELKHRIKNIFAITASICNQTLRAGSDPATTSRALQNRLHALAAAQDAVDDVSEGADLAALVSKVVSPLSPSLTRLVITGTRVKIAADDVTSLALILNELATNAVKHGALSNDRGRVEVRWSLATENDAESVVLAWTERDGPVVEPATRTGLGTKLIEMGLRRGSVTHELKPDGLSCRISLPSQPTMRAAGSLVRPRLA